LIRFIVYIYSNMLFTIYLCYNNYEYVLTHLYERRDLYGKEEKT